MLYINHVLLTYLLIYLLSCALISLVRCTEVVYAVESRKEIIPLTVEPRYKPHGWLKFHMSDKLCLDVSSDSVFHDSVKKLLGALRKIFSGSQTAAGQC